MKTLLDEETGQRYEVRSSYASNLNSNCTVVYISPKREKFRDNDIVGFKAYEYNGIPIIVSENPERTFFELLNQGYKVANLDTFYHQLEIDKWAKYSEGWCP